MSLAVKAGNQWLASIGAWGDLEFSTDISLGSDKASWRMDLPPTFSHPALTTGRPIEIRGGSMNVFEGLLNQPLLDDDGWKFSVLGLAHEGKSYLCLDNAGNTTSRPNTAVDEAIARGLPWIRQASLSSAPFAPTDTTDALNYVGDLLDAWADSVSKRWCVDANGVVGAFAEPTVPSYYMTPGSGRIGLDDDDYASDLYVRHQPTATTYATVHLSDPTAAAQRRREYPLDATVLGVMNTAAATGFGNGRFARGKARFAWTDPVNPFQFQLTTPGGNPVDLRFVKAGEMVRLHGVLNQQGFPLPYVDWTIGHTSYKQDARTIELAPTRLAARSLGDIFNALAKVS